MIKLDKLFTDQEIIEAFRSDNLFGNSWVDKDPITGLPCISTHLYNGQMEYYIDIDCTLNFKQIQMLHFLMEREAQKDRKP